MRFLTVFIIVVIALGLKSCWCSCNCKKNFACVIATARYGGGDSVIAQKTFCSQTDVSYEIDERLNDSIKSFKTRHPAPNAIVDTRDSILQTQALEKMSCKKSEEPKNKGFFCQCYK